MSTEKKVLLAVSVVVGLLVVVLFSSEVIEKEIAPRPKAAWVAIEVGDSGLARTGPVEIESGTSFRLHAVMEAETFTGDTIYYTEAKQLELQGVAIPSSALRVWNRSSEPRVLWFTVDGFRPYVELGSGFDLQDFRFQENFRADWPRTWSIPGDLQPLGERDMKSGPVEGLSRFGTQRYHVRVEIFGPKSEITPAIRLQSLKAEDLPERSAEFSTVRATLPNGLAVPTGVYGLSQIEAHSEVEDSVAEQLTDWFQGGLTFSRLRLLREILKRAGTNYGDLQWSAVELNVDQVWSETAVGAGDLLRVGDRWVVILHDTAVDGLLDRSDLCLDFDKGARIRQIGEVFTGEGLVEWASLALQRDSTGE